MTRRLLLASGTAATVPPPVDPDPDPGDATVSALLPAGTPAYEQTITPGSTADTLVPALAAGAAAASGSDPSQFYRINLTAGTYEGTAANGVETVNGDWAHLRGLGVGPADTVVQSGVQGQGTLFTHGSTYLQNLTIRAHSNDSVGGPRYPWHISLGKMVVAVDCVFDILDAAPPTSGGLVGTSACTGADGDDGMMIVFYRCTFKRDPLKHGPDNMHGPVPWNPTPEPMTVAYIDCDFQGSGELVFEGTGAIDGRNDQLYVLGCTGVTSISGVNPSYPATDGNTDVFTDDMTVSVTNAANVTRGVTSWPEPVAGLSAYWTDVYA